MTGTPSNTVESKCKVPWAGYGARDKKTVPQSRGPAVATSRKLEVPHVSDSAHDGIRTWEVPHMIGSARDRFRT